MKNELTKKQRSQLRRLAAECHERELEEAMTDLYEQFQKWGGKGISVFELNDRIHEFHDGISRDLYKRYVMGDPYISVDCALRNGILGEPEVNEDLLNVFKRHW